jgi:hypothetical protein
MPLTRYFAWVGSVLLALLFIADACLPKSLPIAKGDASLPLIRIHSERKWPERVVFDTRAPIMISARSEDSDAGSQAPSIAVASRGVREAFAEQRTADARPPAANPKKPEARRPQHLKLVKRQVAKPLRFAERRSPYGWFGPTIW